MERVVFSFTYVGELSEEQLDDLGEKMQAVFPEALLEDCYTEDAS